ncbi:hypothetical protein ACN20G_33525 (plasmid) [Streptomyces sp. BI20]|uniref:hypothetical protein n=1 Tax=Streptomyces sp. BI20 TaxID=3403460 RepID=UPI003C719E10
MKAPEIEIDSTGGRYRYLWLKYVTGVDLTRHCARSLHGTYSRLVSPELEHMGGVLDEARPPLAWYLCGVTSRWADNAHLAFEAAASDEEHADLEVLGLRVTLRGARPIRFGADAIPEDDPRAGDPAFATCRNWQFAHHLARARGLSSIPNRPGRARAWRVRGQMPLL